jgi:hypothetical protein
MYTDFRLIIPNNINSRRVTEIDVYATFRACKTAYPGSIPGVASIIFFRLCTGNARRELGAGPHLYVSFVYTAAKFDAPFH